MLQFTFTVLHFALIFIVSLNVSYVILGKCSKPHIKFGPETGRNSQFKGSRNIKVYRLSLEMNVFKLFWKKRVEGEKSKFVPEIF